MHLTGDFGFFLSWSQASEELLQCPAPWSIIASLGVVSLHIHGQAPSASLSLTNKPHLAPRNSHLMRNKSCESIYSGANPGRKESLRWDLVKLFVFLSGPGFPWSPEKGECGRWAVAAGLSSCLRIHPAPHGWPDPADLRCHLKAIPCSQMPRQFRLSSSLSKMCPVLVPRTGAI